MSLLGKWQVIEVFKDFDSDLHPQYVSKEEALKLDEYKDKDSIQFINSIYVFKNDGIDVVYNGEVVNTIKTQLIDGSYYITEGGIENKFELKPDQNGLVSLMTILKLKKLC